MWLCAGTITEASGAAGVPSNPKSRKLTVALSSPGLLIANALSEDPGRAASKFPDVSTKSRKDEPTGVAGIAVLAVVMPPVWNESVTNPDGLGIPLVGVTRIQPGCTSELTPVG